MDAWDILLFVGICFALYKVGHIGTTMLLNKYFVKSKYKTASEETTVVKGEARQEILDICLKYELTETQILGLFLTLTGEVVTIRGSDKVSAVDEKAKKKYTIIVEDE